MSKEIFERAIVELNGEKESILQNEFNKIQAEIIAPKFALFEQDYNNQVQLESDRYNKALMDLQNGLTTRKETFQNTIKNSINVEIEKKYHFDADIAQLTKLIEERK